MPAIRDFLHIKSPTIGTSNELSLDVLDAARTELDGGRKRSHRQPRPSGVPGPAQGSYHGVKGSSALAGVPEVERRKRARRARTARMWVVGIVLLAVLIGAGTYFGYRFYQERVDFNGRFTALVDQLVEIDRTLVNIDIIMKDPLSTSEGEGRVEALGSVPQLQADLEQVRADAQEMIDEAGADDDVAALGEVVLAADARREMLESASEALTLSAKVSSQMSKASSTWTKVVDADQEAQEAAMLANQAATEDETVAARDKTYSALDLMNEALEDFGELRKSNPGLNVSSYKAYLEKRVKALGYAVETSNALLANNRQAATSANNSYNALEREAADMVSDLPASLTDEVKAVYSEQMESLEDDYQQVRAHVTQTDSELRDRLRRI